MTYFFPGIALMVGRSALSVPLVGVPPPVGMRVTARRKDVVGPSTVDDGGSPGRADMICTPGAHCSSPFNSGKIAAPKFARGPRLRMILATVTRTCIHLFSFSMLPERS